MARKVSGKAGVVCITTLKEKSFNTKEDAEQAGKKGGEGTSLDLMRKIIGDFGQVSFCGMVRTKGEIAVG